MELTELVFTCMLLIYIMHFFIYSNILFSNFFNLFILFIYWWTEIEVWDDHIDVLNQKLQVDLLLWMIRGSGHLGIFLATWESPLGRGEAGGGEAAGGPSWRR